MHSYISITAFFGYLRNYPKLLLHTFISEARWVRTLLIMGDWKPHLVHTLGIMNTWNKVNPSRISISPQNNYSSSALPRLENKQFDDIFQLRQTKMPCKWSNEVYILLCLSFETKKSCLVVCVWWKRPMVFVHFHRSRLIIQKT